MANRAEDHKVLPADHQRRAEAIPDNELSEECSDEEEFPPEEVEHSDPDSRRRTKAIPEHHDNELTSDSDEEEFEPDDIGHSDPDSRFIDRGMHEPRQISANTANLQPSSSNTHNNQNQSYSQNSVSQKKTPYTPRQVDPKRYPKGT
ncbi:hypothetical protein M405DRAFT_807097 [Rhizopogon salebrosus TDB-379]|nr:hypothetical protein M405DRAFT_807097 [Rhizopogon salebrosus TDB-379]